MQETEIESSTPRLASLCFQLIVLSSDLDRQLTSLSRHLGINKEETIVLLPALHNVVDRDKIKRRHKKQWKVELHDIIKDSICFDEELN